MRSYISHATERVTRRASLELERTANAVITTRADSPLRRFDTQSLPAPIAHVGRFDYRCARTNGLPTQLIYNTHQLTGSSTLGSTRRYSYISSDQPGPLINASPDTRQNCAAPGQCQYSEVPSLSTYRPILYKEELQPALLYAFISYRDGLDRGNTDQRHRFARRVESENLDFAGSLKVWSDFHAWYESVEPKDQDLETFLSGDQHKSYRVIKEFIQRMSRKSRTPKSVEELVSEVMDAKDSDDYVKTMAHLLIHEMEGIHIDDMRLFQLVDLRLEAFQAANVLKVASSYFRGLRQANPPIGLGEPTALAGFETTRPVLRSKDLKETPYYLWNRQTRELLVVDRPGACPEYTCISHTWGRWRTGLVDVAGVPWPVPGNSRFDVRGLPEFFSKIDIPTTCIWFDLFCIPQDSKLSERKAKEIVKQAAIFRNSSACVAWMNDVRSWKKLSSAIEIFALAYLVSNSGLDHSGADTYLQKVKAAADNAEDLFQKITFPETRSDQGSTSIRQLYKEPTKSQSRFHSSFCCSRTPEECSSYRKLLEHNLDGLELFDAALEIFNFPDWFASLWTLQEACLCPSMSIASASFDYLQTQEGIHVTLDTLKTFVSSMSSPVMTMTSARQVHLCLPKGYAHLDAMDIILMSDKRRYTGHRAPAIMNALNITDWYQAQIEDSTQTPGGGPLVYGKFSFPFVQEAAKKIGPIFFATYVDDCLATKSGSMPPFNNSKAGVARLDLQRQRQHGNHDSWEIAADGGMIIKNAVVVASTQSRNQSSEQTQESDRQLARVFGFPDLHEKEKALRDVLQVVLSNNGATLDRAFAVHLAQDSYKQIGIILAGKFCEKQDGIVKLRKCGAYILPHSDADSVKTTKHNDWPPLPEPQKVNWLAY